MCYLNDKTECAGCLEESGCFGTFGLGKLLYIISRAYWFILVGSCKIVGGGASRTAEAKVDNFQRRTALVTVIEIILFLFWQRHLLSSLVLRTYRLHLKTIG